MEYFVRHRTTYRYLQDVSHSWHLAHLRPRATPLQAVHMRTPLLTDAHDGCLLSQSAHCWLPSLAMNSSSS